MSKKFDATHGAFARSLRQFCRNHAPPDSTGLELTEGDEPLATGRFFMAWDIAFSINVRLDCSFTKDNEPVIEIGWGGSNRSLIAATACVALYQKVVSFAALLECWLAQYIKETERGR